jgi:hypothetical protein
MDTQDRVGQRTKNGQHANKNVWDRKDWFARLKAEQNAPLVRIVPEEIALDAGVSVEAVVDRIALAVEAGRFIPTAVPGVYRYRAHLVDRQHALRVYRTARAVGRLGTAVNDISFYEFDGEYEEGSDDHAVVR